MFCDGWGFKMMHHIPNMDSVKVNAIILLTATDK